MRENNWPPLPIWCPIKPCFYQDFSTEIPADYQRICKMLYYLWMCESCSCPFELQGEMGCDLTALSVLWLLLPGWLQSSSVLGWGGGAFSHVTGPLQSAPCLGTSPKGPVQATDQVGWDRLGASEFLCSSLH